MSSSAGVLKWLCWALVVFVIASALLTIGTNPSLGLLVKDADTSNTPDLVDRLALILAANQAAQPMFLLAGLVSLGVFVLATLLGVALRPFAAPSGARDVMAALFILGGVVGVVAQLVLIGANDTAAHGYCDCGYKAEELIAQSKALDLGFTVQDWLNVASLTTIGVAAAMAGSQLVVSSAWRTLSYVIAIVLVIAAILFLVGQGDYATYVTALGGILVAIWAALLARAVPTMSSGAAAAG